jgi:hypothetical protein
MKRSAPIQRRTPLRNKAPLRAGPPPKRKTPMKRTNPRRKRERFERAYHSAGFVWFVHSLRCAVLPCESAAECAHTVSRARGGTWETIAPLCREHHAALHDMGTRAFEQRHRLDLADLAAQTALRWKIIAKGV